jgi:oligopeptide/dipeptide ABC transporter ATP-binding protein
MQAIRGNSIGMIFQEPMTSLNPVYSVGFQVAESLSIHHPELSARQKKDRAIEMLVQVGIPEAARRYDDYPHQMSGGMRQRIMIAMALSCSPKLLIADEPTTALDVTIQAQILELIRRLQRELGMTVLLITHDLGVVAETVDEVMVMYAGKVVERTSAETLFEEPLHPYTRGLLGSIPSSYASGGRLTGIPGSVPSLVHLPLGCRFADRCSLAKEHCREAEPTLEEKRTGHRVGCHEVACPRPSASPERER